MCLIPVTHYNLLLLASLPYTLPIGLGYLSRGVWYIGGILVGLVGKGSGMGIDRNSRVTDAGHYYIHLPIHPLLQSYPY